MFNTISGIKKSFYSQTGDFQFNTNIIVDSAFGGLNVGVSGDLNNKINFYCNSGKILDGSGRFVSAYKPNVQFSISGNVSENFYDYFINGTPISFHNYKPSGAINYFYLKSINNNLNIQYNLFVNGESPSLTVSNVELFSGDIAGTGTITNSKPQLPIIIYSGGFTNFSSNLPFSLSGLFTGGLTTPQKYYIIPSGQESVGQYTGNLTLFTNGGVISDSISIHISGSESPVDYSINLNGANTITVNTNQDYTSNVQYLSGSGIPILVSLEHVTGSGNYYTSIPVFSGYTGRIVNGYIYNSGYLTGYVTGMGTGAGGFLNILTTGGVTGYATGIAQWATGNFTWPYTVLMTGYGTGINYSGFGSGNYFTTITGTILNGSGTYTVNSQYTGRLGYLYSIDETGNGLGIGTQLFQPPFLVTGFIENTFTGSGYYTQTSGSGNLHGSGYVLNYTKQFTGSWTLKTGNPYSQVDYWSGGYYNAGQNKYLNNLPVWYFNSTSYINVGYTNIYDFLPDVALLTVSGLNFNISSQKYITGVSS